MKEQKNIDKLFQEQLKDFEAAPSPAVWKKIEAQLKKKKERRVIPIWWRAGGVAAILLLLLAVGLPLFNDSDDINTTPEIVQENTDNISKEKDSSDVEKISEDPDSFITSSETTSDKSNQEKEVNTSTYSKDTNEKSEFLDPITTKDGVATTLKNTQEETTKSSVKFNNKAIVSDNTSSEKNTGIAQNKTPSSNNSEDIISNNDPLKTSEVDGVASASSVTSNDTKSETSETNKTQIVNPILKEAEATSVAEEETKKEVEEASKKSIFEAIEEAKNEEEAIAQQKTKNNGAWEVTPNVGPVYYSSLGQGSSIDPAFADNSQTGDINISYGVQVAYNINDRVSVRSGVNNVNVGYSTGGIEVISGPQAIGLRSVNYNSGGRSILSAVDTGQGMILADNSNPLNQINLKSTSASAELIQNISYFEVPLELKYKLVNKRFGVNMIGGFSTLFLGDNEIVVTDGSFRNQLGEANNLNNLSFTTNVGIGLDYLISRKLRFNLEPMFKYQLNPYSDTSVDFRPYYLGVYSGLTFKF